MKTYTRLTHTIPDGRPDYWLIHYTSNRQPRTVYDYDNLPKAIKDNLAKNYEIPKSRRSEYTNATFITYRLR